MRLSRLRDPHDMGAMALVAALLLAGEMVLCVGIVQRIPCTSPSTNRYMQTGCGFDQWFTRQPPCSVCTQLRPGPAGWPGATLSVMPGGCVDTQIRRLIGWRTCRRCWCVAGTNPKCHAPPQSSQPVCSNDRTGSKRAGHWCRCCEQPLSARRLDDTRGRCRATWAGRWTTPSLRVHTHCISTVFDPVHAVGAKALTPLFAAGEGGGLSGDTGALVYPAGFVYVFSVLHYLTKGDVHIGQVWPIVVTLAFHRPLVGRRLPTCNGL
jgi:hypothetical protein